MTNRHSFIIHAISGSSIDRICHGGDKNYRAILNRDFFTIANSV